MPVDTQYVADELLDRPSRVQEIRARTVSALQSRAIGHVLPLIAFLFAVLCTAIPIGLHSFQPLVDLPNHIARQHIANTHDGPLLQYYDQTAGLLPNSAADILWSWTPSSITPLRLHQMLMIMYAVSLIGATMVLSRVVNKQWSTWPATAGLLVYNANFFWGFENYLLSVPAAILALSLWIASERGSLLLRVLFFAFAAFAIYLMHFFGFAIFAVAAFGRELQLLLAAGPRWPRQLARGLVLALPFLPTLGWHFYSKWTAPLSPLLMHPASTDGSTTAFGSILSRIALFTSPFTTVPFLGSAMTIVPEINLIGLVTLIFFVFCLLRMRGGSGPRLVLNESLMGPIVALVIAASLMPVSLEGVSLVHLRLPFVLLLIVVAGTTWMNLNYRHARSLALCAGLLLGAKGLVYERLAAHHETEMQDLMTVVEKLPRGARLLPVRAPRSEWDTRLWHVQAYAVLERDAFIPTIFQGSHNLQVRPEWIRSSHPAIYPPDLRRLWMMGPEPLERLADRRFDFLANWEEDFTHVLVLDQIDFQIGRGLQLVSLSGRFALYRITAPG